MYINKIHNIYFIFSAFEIVVFHLTMHEMVCIYIKYYQHFIYAVLDVCVCVCVCVLVCALTLPSTCTHHSTFTQIIRPLDRFGNT